MGFFEPFDRMNYISFVRIRIVRLLKNYSTISHNLQNTQRKTVDSDKVRPLAIQGGAA